MRTLIREQAKNKGVTIQVRKNNKSKSLTIYPEKDESPEELIKIIAKFFEDIYPSIIKDE